MRRTATTDKDCVGRLCGRKTGRWKVVTREEKWISPNISCVLRGVRIICSTAQYCTVIVMWGRAHMSITVQYYK
jgi:hypothetical protein